MMGAAQNNVSPGARKCPNCGSVIAAEANFCGQCGSKMQ
ncbi:zinc ribbon domain-containing protein [Methanohalophilus sp.]